MTAKLKLAITGATGFIGHHVVEAALSSGHSVVAIGRNEERGLSMPWASRVTLVFSDLFSPEFDSRSFGDCDAMLHLAWPGLPDFKTQAHLDEHLPANIRFLEKMLKAGLPRLVVTGTCLEYGIINGELSEQTPCRPTVPYAQAKDRLRQHLETHLPPHATLCWARLFYMHGQGQHPRSVLAQLDSAIDKGDTIFPMSKGEQLRDYLPVAEVAHKLIELVEAPNASGIYNICSGQPISIRTLVETRIAERNAEIRPQLGHYPYPDYEAMAFWGNTLKFQREIETPHE